MEVSSPSMEGTIHRGDIVWLSPALSFDRNDIVAFKYTHNSQKQVWQEITDIMRGIPGI